MGACGGAANSYGESSTSASSPVLSNGGTKLSSTPIGLSSTPVRTTKASRLRAAALGKKNFSFSKLLSFNCFNFRAM